MAALGAFALFWCTTVGDLVGHVLPYNLVMNINGKHLCHYSDTRWKILQMSQSMVFNLDVLLLSEL